jgi:hypothetical protein
MELKLQEKLVELLVVLERAHTLFLIVSLSLRENHRSLRIAYPRLARQQFFTLGSTAYTH